MKHYLALLILLALFSCEQEQIFPERPLGKIWIWDAPGSDHSLKIIETFKSEYGEIEKGRILERWDLDIDSVGVGDVVILSYPEAWSYIAWWGFKITRGGALFCVPLGSNENVRLDEYLTTPGTAISGASRECENFTAFGPNLQFVENAEASSFANPIVAAKLLKIAEATRINRFELIITAAEATGHAWSELNGVGCIDVEGAIQYLKK